MSDLQDSYGPAYAFTNPSIDLGCVVHGGTVHADLPVRVPLSMMNRHGLIAGSTGTGKTRTLQLLAEGLSRAGVPVVVSDVKGDLSGLAKEGPAGEKVITRMKGMGRE
ncbi:MAG: helicase HerA-like domain-containing protein, partial [Thermoanaerobaculia bacterium]